MSSRYKQKSAVRLFKAVMYSFVT